MNIVRLLRKDILNMGWSSLIAFVAPWFTFMILLSTMVDMGRLIPIGFYLTIVVSVSCISATFVSFFEEYYKTEVFAMSLPVSRNDFVISRYISAFVLMLVCLFCAILAFLISEYIWDIRIDPVLDYIYQPEVWLFTICLMILLLAVAYPICFRFGLSKGIMTMISMCVILFVVCCYFYYYFPVDELFHDWFERGFFNSVFVETLDVIDTPEFQKIIISRSGSEIISYRTVNLIVNSLQMLAVSTGILFMSLMISCKFYKKRDI